MYFILIAIGLVGIGVGIYFYYSYAKEKERKRLELVDKVNDLLPSASKLLVKFNSLTDFKNGYFNNFKLVKWKKSAQPVRNKLEKIPYAKIKLEQSKVDQLNDFMLKWNNAESTRTSYNKAFVESELRECSSFFDDIEDKKLDNQQRRAIIVDEDNNIVVAGAGSGKTTTIAGKVSYLVTRFNVAPSDLLLISFTRKACEQMRTRIKQRMNIDVDVMTFHKLGKEIIAEAKNEQPSVFDESKLTDLMNGFLSELMEDGDYLSQVTTFFTSYLKPYKKDEDFKSHGEYIQFIKDNNIKSFKQVLIPINGNQSLVREQCKSIDEVVIANFLFLNNINYEYERKYEHKTSDREYQQYKPDFYLTDYGIYIEHFAVNRNGEVPHWFSGDEDRTPTEKYRDGMNWKRGIHNQHGTTMVETYSYERQEGNLLDNLESKLSEHGVVFNPKSPEEVWDIINQVAKDEVTNFTQLIITFLTLLKSNNYSLREIKERNHELYAGFERKRNDVFIELFTPILESYNSHLRDIAEIDFSDMINDATQLIQVGKSEIKYKYIIVDEFQDISIGRYRLIKAILDKNPGCKLFCVGDDWQSIYRFSGSDISIFTEFEKHFGITEKSFIETTYRFNSKLISISSEFILKNDKQIKKKLRSFNNEDFEPYQILYSDSIHNDDTTPVIDALNIIIQEIWDEPLNHKVLALGRYSHDVDAIKKDTRNFSVTWDRTSESYKIKYNYLPDLEIEFLTVHRAKGLEADYVLLLNCSSGKYGFPSEQADDLILNLLLTKADQFPNGEERRVFYVAMTRCKRKVFMIAKNKYKSKFIVELERQGQVAEVRLCPQCKTGNLIERSGVKNDREWRNLTCSNWNWRCDYLEWLT